VAYSAPVESEGKLMFFFTCNWHALHKHKEQINGRDWLHHFLLRRLWEATMPTRKGGPYRAF